MCPHCNITTFQFFKQISQSDGKILTKIKKTIKNSKSSKQIMKSTVCYDIASTCDKVLKHIYPLPQLLYFKCSHLLIPLQVPPSQKPALKLLMSTVLHLKSLRQDIFHFVSMEIWWIWYSNLPPIWCIFIGILINPNS